MPVPAPSGGGGSPAAAPGFEITRTYTDPLGRPMTGTVTVKMLDAPYMSVSVDLSASGGFRIRVTEPGRYSLGAMLRDEDNGRAYIAEEISVGKENS